MDFSHSREDEISASGGWGNGKLRHVFELMVGGKLGLLLLHVVYLYGVSFVEPVFMTGIEGIHNSREVPRNTHVPICILRIRSYICYNLQFDVRVLLLGYYTHRISSVCFFIQMMPPGSAAAFRFYDRTSFWRANMRRRCVLLLATFTLHAANAYAFARKGVA